MTTRTPLQTTVLILGAGFGGLGLALELKRNGFHDFLVLDKGADVGGVWRENTYPGAACDVASVLYSYSFEPNREWSSRYSRQSDIQDYLRRTVKKHGVDGHLRFGVEVTDADFDETTGYWHVATSTGQVYEAKVFVPAVGQLSRPSTPHIEGAETFAGTAFHSAEWDHSVDVTGKRVAIIGTGASAIQIVPAIQPDVAQMTVFQRSAPHIIPKLETEFSSLHHRVFKTLPILQTAERFGWYAFYEMVTVGLVGNEPIKKLFGRLAQRHLHKQVADPALREKLTPDYAVGCKRGMLSSDYYPAVCEDNVSVETTAIARVVPEGVETADGVVHPADVIVYCTGFTATDFLAPLHVRGLGGKDLRETWQTGARAYLGMAAPGFPNLFVMYGPNTNVGSGSIIYMLERQARYIRLAVEALTATGAAYVEVKQEVEDAFDAEIQSRLAGTVWSGCSSWYRAPDGRIAANWPGIVREYDRRTRTFELEEYDVVGAAQPIGPV